MKDVNIELVSDGLDLVKILYIRNDMIKFFINEIGVLRVVIRLEGTMLLSVKKQIIRSAQV